MGNCGDPHCPWSGNYCSDRDMSLTPPRVGLWKEITQVGYSEKPDIIKVYWVDGFYIRNTISMEFIDGGHGYVYDFIPEDEIWVEDDEDDDLRDEEMDLLHEYTERTLMKYGDDGNVEYEEAHGASNHAERLARKEWADSDYQGTSPRGKEE
jgi:hypothetical protein